MGERQREIDRLISELNELHPGRIGIGEWNEATLRLAALAFESSSEAVMITDRYGNILLVNPAFTALTGYRQEDVFGKNPRILSSGRHGPEFYVNMWASLFDTGSWTGEIWNRRKDGCVYLEHLTIKAIRDQAGNHAYYLGIFRDITERKRYEEQIQYLAYYDHLTGLPNRLLFEERFVRELERSAATNTQLALLFVDLDRFKLINDSLGHATGDALLKSVAQRITESVERHELVCRLGGDEFNLLLLDIPSAEHAMTAAERLLHALTQPYFINGQELYIGASIGISLYPHDGEDVATLLRNADAAMYRAKELGGNACLFYCREMNARATCQLELEAALRKARNEHEFSVEYQPQVHLVDGRPVGVEALIRWHHPQWGKISPADFVPLAEKLGLIRELDAWVLAEACRQARQWQEQTGLESLRLAVNISVSWFEDPAFVETVANVLRDIGFNPGLLELELTESAFIKQVDAAAETLSRLKALGVRLAIDDLGTGYSSLRYVSRFPVDTLKIDRTFVANLETGSGDAAVVRTIILLAKSLALDTIAEGIETKEQQRMLWEWGCAIGQGYLFSQPLPVEECEAFLQRKSGAGAADSFRNG